MYKIATLNKISKVGLGLLDANYEITEEVETAQGILVRSQDMHSMDFSDNLLAVARAGAGVNNIPLDKCADKGIVVFNTPGANANAVKELVIAGLFLAARNIPGALSWASSLTENVSAAVEKGKSQFAGREITGKTLGVVGLGAIGRKVAASAEGLGMNIVGYDPFYSGNGEIKVYSDLSEMLPLCDYVTIHVPAMDSTKGMFNKELFESFKEDTVLLNFSRDKLVNDADLLDAIEAGKVGCYVTDFPNDNLINRDKVILLPHLGASTEEAEDNCASMAVLQMRDYIENGNIKNSVNFPAVDMDSLESGSRLGFFTKDIENPVDAVLEIAKKNNINVVKHAGSTKGQYGYVLVETDAADFSEASLNALKAEGIIKVRKF
ncbi:MAG: 3-phosphoglycerate dehydrogenase family protein [Firmicutes bacterium]|nr:3-phosphoglycerate dehydrogenase family protein [Bacillota bacterium]